MGRVSRTSLARLPGDETDLVVGPEFVHLCEVAFTNRTGPVVLPGVGHFLQWERADLFNALVIAFLGDVRV